MLQLISSLLKRLCMTVKTYAVWTLKRNMRKITSLFKGDLESS